MGEENPIPTLIFDGQSMGSKHCFDAWRETLRCVYNVEPLSDQKSETEKLEGWFLDNLIFTEVAFSKQAFSHHTTLLHDANYLSLQIYKSGGSKGTTADQPWIMKPGQVHIYDFSREFHSVAEKSVVSGVKIPHEAVGYDPSKHPAHMSFSGNSPLGSLLLKSYYTIQNRLPDIQQQESVILAQAYCGLLRGLFDPLNMEQPSAAKKFATERRAAMRSYLDRNLSDPDLGIEQLLRSFGVSRPSVYRDFSDVGGVSSYISSRRLDRAFHQLLSTEPSHGRVKEIANRLGFKDTAHFSRLFRQRFGVTPGNVMTRQRPGSFASRMANDHNTPPVSRCLSDWFNSI